MKVGRLLGNLIRPLRKVKACIDELCVSYLRHVDGPAAEKLRYRYYRSRVKMMGKNVRIDTGVFLYGAAYISLGDDTHIDKNCIIIGAPKDLDLSKRIVKRRALASNKAQEGEVSIGRNCHISQNCMIYGYGGVYIADNCVMAPARKSILLPVCPITPTMRCR